MARRVLGATSHEAKNPGRPRVRVPVLRGGRGKRGGEERVQILVRYTTSWLGKYTTGSLGPLFALGASGTNLLDCAMQKIRRLVAQSED